MKENSPTADLLALHLDNAKITQVEVARRVGYKPNVISMFKLGTSPIPIAKIPALSQVLGIDPQRFLRTALEEYHPEMLEVIESIHGHLLTENEEALLKRFREELQDEALVIDSDEKERAFDRLACLMGDAPESIDKPDWEEQAHRVTETKTIPNFTLIQRPTPYFSAADEIAKLVELRDLGILAEKEYAYLKASTITRQN